MKNFKVNFEDVREERSHSSNKPIIIGAINMSSINFVILALLMLPKTQVSCKSLNNSSATDSIEQNSVSQSSDQLEESLFRSEEPRQYFRINVGSSSLGKRRRVAKGEQTFKRAAAFSTQSDSSQSDKSNKSKITNATLKKLLNQSLLKTSNGTLTSGNSSTKGSNFKFVFIQRAAAPPNSTSTNDTGKKPTGLQSSLAASVSKQLANTLLNSAVNMMSNITNSAPSLSSIASQIVVQSLENMSPKTSSTPAPDSSLKSLANSINSNTLNSDGSEDIKRIQTEKKKATNNIKKQNGKTRPSKIYNLPVKFVSNGQPNGVMFNTIKQHFATIKRLQMATSKLGGSSYNQQAKRRRPMKGQKVKGNSRLIYLPLRYLSNARPNKILTSKATHKSISN